MSCAASSRRAPPERESRPFEFDPATVEFADLDSGTPTQSSVDVFWPRLIVNTRIGPGDLTVLPSPWRGEVASVPEPSYRVSPSVLIALLLGGALRPRSRRWRAAYAGWPRREAEPEPEPIVVPEFSLTPLEQALELLEDAARANGAADQRRSLELVAEVLAQRGDADGLAPAARELAWSPTPPPPEATKGLAARVRATLDAELRRLEADAGRRKPRPPPRQRPRRRPVLGGVARSGRSRAATRGRCAAGHEDGRAPLGHRGAAVALLAASVATARDLDPRTGACSDTAPGVVVLDLSLSILDDHSGIIRGPSSASSTPTFPSGLVVFSDVPYELLPPGTPPPS